MTAYRKSTRLWLWMLGVWAVIGFSQTKLIPGQWVVAVAVVLSALVLLSHYRAIRVVWLPVALAVTALLSLTWATTDGSQRTYLFVAVVLAGTVFASYVPVATAIRILDIGFKTVAVVTILMWALFQTAAVETRFPNTGTLIGPYVQKNILGIVLLLGLVTTLYASGRRRPRTFIWVLIYLTLLWSARSSAATALAVLSIVIYLVMRRWGAMERRRRAVSVFLTALVLAVLTPLALNNLESILGLLGRDATLSGRSRIWDGTLYAWSLEPILGYGWGAAFDPLNGASAIISAFTFWAVPSSHSGYLTVALYVGWVGFALLVAYTALILFRSFATAAKTATTESRWLFQIVLVFAVANGIDTWIDNTAWFLAVAAGVWLKTPRETKLITPARRILADRSTL